MFESPLVDVLRDATEVLRSERVPHALIGGVAAIAFGNTRATRDVDLSVIIPDTERGRLIEALVGHGFSEVAVRGAVIQARHHSGYRLDLLCAESEFEAMLVHAALPTSTLGCDVPTALLADLVAFKILAGRPRDLRDIEELAEHHPALRWTRVVEMLTLLGVDGSADELARATAEDELRPVLRRLAAAVRV